MHIVLFDASKGFCYGHENILKKLNRSKSLTTNGFNQLPWENHFTEEQTPEVKDDTEEDNSLKYSGKAKLSKQERKELRMQKKINASENRKKKLQIIPDHKKSQQIDNDNFNPFIAKKEMRQIYGDIMKIYNEPINSRKEFKLIQYKSIAIYKSDLEFIKPGEWLNDNNISFIFEIIDELFIKPSKFSYEVSLLVPSVIQLFLHLPINNELPNLLPLDELKKLKFIFIPFNFIDDYEETNLEDANNGDHWMLCVLCLLNNKLYIYDSMADDDEENDKLLQELVKRLKLCKFNNGSPIEIIKMNCDQQDNSDDCGVYLIMITCLLIKRLFYGDKSDLEIENNEGLEHLSDDDYSVNLDISKVKFNALDARLFMMNLIFRLIKIDQSMN